MQANYDNAAWFYDRLSRIVYGKALINAQLYLLTHVPAKSNVLIVGGGSGWILEELAQVHPVGLNITYVEISANMMALSKKRNIGNNTVTYLNSAVQDAILSTKFDVIITAFLFDNFKADTLVKVFGQLHQNLKTGGLWLNTDFQITGKWWQDALLKSMLLFFRILCSVEATTLPDIDGQFSRNSYQVIASKNFFGDFISSKAHQRS
jgi:ubiquinone/menaquinone biosynthesis C-methylase UbiE